MRTNRSPVAVVSRRFRFRQLAAVRAPLAAAGNPVVLGGDLNAGPASDTLQLARTFLQDAWQAAGTGTGATAPAPDPRIRIDYLLYGSPLEVERVDVQGQVEGVNLQPDTTRAAAGSGAPK